MPQINKYKCNQCGLNFPEGWGGFLFAENDKGKRIHCPHPCEEDMIKAILGKNSLIRLIKGKTIQKRVGYASDCLCLDCLNQFTADLADEKGELTWRYFYKKSVGMEGGKDKRECPKCKSDKIRTLSELLNKPCPKCQKGTITEIDTGVVS